MNTEALGLEAEVEEPNVPADPDVEDVFPPSLPVGGAPTPPLGTDRLSPPAPSERSRRAILKNIAPPQKVLTLARDSGGKLFPPGAGVQLIGTGKLRRRKLGSKLGGKVSVDTAEAAHHAFFLAATTRLTQSMIERRCMWHSRNWNIVIPPPR